MKRSITEWVDQQYDYFVVTNEPSYVYNQTTRLPRDYRIYESTQQKDLWVIGDAYNTLHSEMISAVGDLEDLDMQNRFFFTHDKETAISAGENDDYRFVYIYDIGYMCDRYGEFSKSELFKEYGEPIDVIDLYDDIDDDYCW